LAGSIALAQDGGPQSPLDPAETLTTAFTYQGRLDEDGSPVNDTCDMRFKLYDAASTGTEIGSDPHAGVLVTDGLFSVPLDFGANVFTGDRRWLGIEVDCEEDGTYVDLGRQELTVAPYALGLKPGAVISGTAAAGEAMLSGYNSGSGFGLAGRSDSGYGVYAYSKSYYGIYVHGVAGDLRLYNGTIYANSSPGADLALYSNDNVDVHLDDNGTASSQFHIRNSADTAVFTVNEAGSVTSNADTQIAVSPLNMVAYSGSVSALELRPEGYYMEVRASSTSGAPAVFVPVDLPSVLFGTPTKLKSVRVCYKCDSSSSYITLNRVRYANDSGGYTELINDDTDRYGTAWGCYTLTDPTPEEIQGSLYVGITMNFNGTGSSHDIQIGKITVTLTEQ
jgi:hypothetical protein